MKRRHFLSAAAAGATAAVPALPFAGEKSNLKITSVRLVHTMPKRPLPAYKRRPRHGRPTVSKLQTRCRSIRSTRRWRSLFLPDPGKLPGFTVEIATDKGVKGYGSGGPGGGTVVEEHLTKLLIGKDPFDIERLWDIMWRSTMSYGRMGISIHAISGVDLALWDLVGNALNMPVYKLIGGATKPQGIPAYCTGNDLEQHVEFGFKRLKLAIPHGPADGRVGMKKNEALVKRTRELLGPDGDIMLDCWMSWTEKYAIDMADMLAPYRIYWMEECLQPHDYAGFGRLREAVKHITRIATGEHEYTRYGYRYLLDHNAADIWQADIHWVGGLSELRKIAAMGAAYEYRCDSARSAARRIVSSSSWRRRMRRGRSCSCPRQAVQKQSTNSGPKRIRSLAVLRASTRSRTIALGLAGNLK